MIDRVAAPPSSSGGPVVELPEDEVHLWFVYPDEWEEAGLLAAASGVLEPGEFARSERFRFPEHRQLFLASRLLLRTTLSRYRSIPPGAWRFVANDYGKPGVAPEAGPAPAFNLAHTAGVAVVAVARGREVGVDVENRGRHVQAEKLIERFFASEEAAELGKLPYSEIRKRFFLIWTLKEAYIKALGRGLAQPLDSFAFRLTGGQPQEIAFSADHPQDRERWRFAIVEPRLRFIAALAVACERAATVTLRCYRCVSPEEISPLAVTPIAFSPGVFCPPPGDAAPEPGHP